MQGNETQPVLVKEENAIMKNFLFISFSLFVVFTGCKKAEDRSCESCMPLTKFGYVIDGWDPALDGIGYYIKLEDITSVHPANLPTEYQQRGIYQKVKISFIYTNEQYTAGMMPAYMPVIKLNSIEKQ